MSLENHRSEERHLALYQSIEHQLIPHSEAPKSSAMSDQFFRSAKKPKIVRAVILSFFVTLFILGASLQYLPYSVLEPYRPTALYRQAESRVVAQANTISTIMNYDRCTDKGGLKVMNTPEYCVIENKRYYKNELTTTPSKTLTIKPVIAFPLRAGEMSSFSPAYIPQTGTTVYSGYSQSNSQTVSQLRIIPNSSIDVSVLTQITQSINGEIPLQTGVQVFELSLGELTQSVTLLDTLTYSKNIEQLYPLTKIKIALTVSPGILDMTSVSLVMIGEDSKQVFLSTQRFPSSFSEALKLNVEKECKQKDGDGYKNCVIGLLSDKSIAEKIQKEVDSLVEYFAFAS